MPGRRWSTPSPTASTMPANSAPGTKGRGGLNWYLPSTISRSGKFRLAALMAMRTSPAAGSGVGRSCQRSASAPSRVSQSQACMGVLVGRGRAPADAPHDTQRGLKQPRPATGPAAAAGRGHGLAQGVGAVGQVGARVGVRRTRAAARCPGWPAACAPACAPGCGRPRASRAGAAARGRQAVDVFALQFAAGRLDGAGAGQVAPQSRATRSCSSPAGRPAPAVELAHAVQDARRQAVAHQVGQHGALQVQQALRHRCSRWAAGRLRRGPGSRAPRAAAARATGAGRRRPARRC
jgi:hypothetical protein